MTHALILCYHLYAMAQQGRTMAKKSKRKRIRKFGFRHLMATVGGKRIVKRRRQKGRKSISVSREFGSKVEKNKKFSRIK